MEIRVKNVRQYLRVMRPLAWWLLLVLVLYTIRTHQRLMEETRLNFNVSLEGKPTDASATLDGKPFLSGEKMSLGNHNFVITHPKGERFATNFFAWYGEKNLRSIDLKRAKGLLVVEAEPPAAFLSVKGPEFNLNLTNSSGTTNMVPTDQYSVTARYRYWEDRRTVFVNATIPESVRIAPGLGALQLTCNQTNASFQLLNSNNDTLETGEFPVLISGLPEGTYQISGFHHTHRLAQKATVLAGTSNRVSLDFEYGTAVLESVPPGASIFAPDGHELGVTPLTLKELRPGAWTFDLRLVNYEPALISIEVAANQTRTAHTNLVSESYTGAMRAARQFMDKGEYDRAAALLVDALRLQPDDAAAASLLREASGLGNIARAEAYGKKGDYIAGIKELRKAQEALPGNVRAKQMMEEFKRHEPEQIEQMRIARLNLGKKTFESLVNEKFPDGALFETRELKTAKALKEVEPLVIAGLEKAQPKFEVKRLESPQHVLALQATQEFSTILATSSGRRTCVLVGAQTKEDETQFLFKVLEYKSEAVEKFSIGAVIGAPVSVKYVPIHSSRLGTVNEKLQARVREGVSNVTSIVQTAIGEAPRARQ